MSRTPSRLPSSSHMQTACDSLLCNALHTNNLSFIVYICAKPFHTNNDFRKKDFFAVEFCLLLHRRRRLLAPLFITFERNVLSWIDKYLFHLLLAVAFVFRRRRNLLNNPSFPSKRLGEFPPPGILPLSFLRDIFCGWFIHGWVFGSMNCAKCNFYIGRRASSIKREISAMMLLVGRGDWIGWMIFV